MRRLIAAMLIGGAVVVSSVQAQQPPATQPATQPGARGARGPRGASGAASAYAREHIPFTNSDISKINPGLPTLFICGDSTAATNGNDIQRGWGAILVDYLDTNKVNLVNYSQAGINFPGYYSSRWPKVVAALKPGDFVVVELGHNTGHLDGTGDETQERPGRGGAAPTTAHTYGWYIRTFIRDARAKGATTIVSTTTVRNIWFNPHAKFNDSKFTSKDDNYNPADDRVERAMGQPLDNGMLAWARQVATEEKTPFLDHCNITADLYDKMGREKVEKLFIQDHTHTTTDGAIVNAETFISGLKALPDMPLNNFLTDKGKAIAAYAPTK